MKNSYTILDLALILINCFSWSTARDLMYTRRWLLMCKVCKLILSLFCDLFLSGRIVFHRSLRNIDEHFVVDIAECMLNFELKKLVSPLKFFLDSAFWFCTPLLTLQFQFFTSKTIENNTSIGSFLVLSKKW